MFFEAHNQFRIEATKSIKGMKPFNPFRNPATSALSFFCFLLLFFLTCGANNLVGADKSMNTKKAIIITIENNGQTMEVEKGELFRIELEELGSAGYRWHLTDLDREYLDLVSKETGPRSGGRLGAPVMALWLLKAKKIGQTQISLDYYRSWEGKEKASEHLSIELIIK
jgi:predicted secreted protein